MACIYCKLHMCFMCDKPKDNDENCCCDGTYGIATFSSLVKTSKEPKEPGIIGRPRKEDADYPPGTPLSKVTVGHREQFKDREYQMGRPFSKDTELLSPTESGRQRAIDIAPIPTGYMCEWSGLLYAGGGIEPIVGCIGNDASNRHHGPSKSTLDNAVGVNLHRICPTCHNRWHSLNDQYYGERPKDGSAYLPLEENGKPKEHDRYTEASPEDIVANDRWWKTTKPDRGSYRSWERVTPVG
jgi:hypothetical protein